MGVVIHAVLALGVLARQDDRPGTLPPMMEFADRTHLLGMTDGLIFVPMYGGLVLAIVNGDVSYAHTSDSGLACNLRTSELSYVSSVDLMDRQIVCPTGLLLRSYRSELAKTGKHSPGLPTGWVHNYDIILKMPTDSDKWQPFTLTYPNKAQETIAPELDPDGKPTGRGRTLSNQTYKVTLAPGPKPNTYEWVRIDWPRSLTHWTFTPHASGPMVLRAIGHEGVGNGEIRLGYLPDRCLANVTFPDQNLTLLTLAYRNGLLATATARGGATTGYTYATVGKDEVLWKVSQPFASGETPKDAYVYSYANGMPYPALSQIAIPWEKGWSKSNVEYRGGRLSAIQTASGVRQEVGPPQG